MARLISPNSVEIDANEGIVKALLDNGYRRAEEGQEKPKRTTTRKKSTTKE
jgi:hypothetical protein